MHQLAIEDACRNPYTSHKRLFGGLWPNPSAVRPLMLPNIDGERSRPCSQGMTRSQNPEDSDRGKMRPFLFGNEVRKVTRESFWPHVMVQSPAEMTRDVF